MKSTDIKNHKTSISQTHNLEVLGSSPSWSTNKKALAISMQVLFLGLWVKNYKQERGNLLLDSFALRWERRSRLLF